MWVREAKEEEMQTGQSCGARGRGGTWKRRGGGRKGALCLVVDLVDLAQKVGRDKVDIRAAREVKIIEHAHDFATLVVYCPP